MYSAWAVKQRSKLIFAMGSVGFVALFIYITVGMYAPPTCHDGKMNQDEVGVDCGGPCDLMCGFQIKPLKTLWTRSFEISKGGLWNAVAYVENPNSEAYVPKAKYRFTLYDKNDKLIFEKEGETFITRDPVIPVFIGRMNIANKKPYRTRFEWLGSFDWYRVGDVHNVKIEEQEFNGDLNRPTITATLINKEPYPLKDIDVVAIVYDENENAVGVSKTYVDFLPPRGKRFLTFSWVSRFKHDPKRWQLIARIPPQED